MSSSTAIRQDPEHIRAMMERVRNGEVMALRELQELYVEKVHVVLCQVIPRQELVHPLERQILMDMWDRRIELIDGVQLDSWICRRCVDSIKQHYLRGRRISARKRNYFLEKLQSMQGALKPEECPIEIDLRRTLWTEVQAYIETQPEGTEPWNFKGVLIWMFMMLLLFVGFVYASVNFSIDLTPPEPPQQSPVANAEDDALPSAEDDTQTLESIEDADPASAPDDVTVSLGDNQELLMLHNEYQELKTAFVDNIDIDESVHDAELQESVKEDLDVVEQSISELVGLLGDEPENQLLEDMLIKTYKKQVKLLRKVAFLNE